MGLLLPIDAARFDKTVNITNAATGLLTARVSPYVFRATSADASASATVLTHTGQTWTTNQWAGYELFLVDSAASAGHVRTIASNTATTITVGVAFPGNIGPCTYEIRRPFGTPEVDFSATSDASASTTVLTDADAAWTVNKYVGYGLRITSGTDSGEIRRIISNTVSTLTVAPAFTGGNIGTASYEILLPTGARPVITGYKITSTIATSANTVTIRSAVDDASTVPRVIAVHDLPVGVTQVSRESIERDGLANGNIEAVVAGSGTGTTRVDIEGFWTAAGWPRSA